ncbi:MAG: hypothetical protein AUG01_05055 [Candidatus Rokubacteria bacterium 13_1_20CM_2_69_58]|nr:MAG: hypothetical protein AUG01_05055 [Candidatus Rokubacteria bacterium 13_1_20CM_2_69_58]PYO81310.1 MAG: DUF1097 domain-containing protein [Gemmatimonadota bacterium]
MDMLMALAVSIGVLIAVWVKVGAMASLAVPAGIVAWACFFAAGGKITGLQKTIASTLSGVVWVWLAMTLIGAMGMGNIAWIIIGVVAFLLVIQSKVAILSFIPGAFCGAAVTAWAAPTDAKGYLMVAVALVAGAVLGYVSEMGAGMIAKKA